VAENSPAEQAGLMPGDRIIQIDDTPIDIVGHDEKAVETIRDLIKAKGKESIKYNCG
jgi:C-terminal processing protease CtpA/Prc